MQILSRKSALELGETIYFTGKPCKHGHYAHRYTKSGGCSECISITSASAREAFNGRKAELRDEIAERRAAKITPLIERRAAKLSALKQSRSACR